MKVTVKAAMTLEVQVIGNWADECSAKQIREQGIDSAMRAVHDMIDAYAKPGNVSRMIITVPPKADLVIIGPPE